MESRRSDPPTKEQIEASIAQAKLLIKELPETNGRWRTAGPPCRDGVPDDWADIHFAEPVGPYDGPDGAL